MEKWKKTDQTPQKKENQQKIETHARMEVSAAVAKVDEPDRDWHTVASLMVFTAENCLVHPRLEEERRGKVMLETPPSISGPWMAVSLVEESILDFEDLRALVDNSFAGLDWALGYSDGVWRLSARAPFVSKKPYAKIRTATLEAFRNYEARLDLDSLGGHAEPRFKQNTTDDPQALSSSSDDDDTACDVLRRCSSTAAEVLTKDFLVFGAVKADGEGAPAFELVGRQECTDAPFLLELNDRNGRVHINNLVRFAKDWSALIDRGIVYLGTDGVATIRMTVGKSLVAPMLTKRTSVVLVGSESPLTRQAALFEDTETSLANAPEKEPEGGVLGKRRRLESDGSLLMRPVRALRRMFE